MNLKDYKLHLCWFKPEDALAALGGTPLTGKIYQIVINNLPITQEDQEMLIDGFYNGHQFLTASYDKNSITYFGHYGKKCVECHHLSGINILQLAAKLGVIEEYHYNKIKELLSESR